MAENDVQTLVDEVEVEGYKIRAWGIVTISRLAGSLERIFAGVVARGITLDTATKEPAKIIFAILPEIPVILSETLNISLAEVDKIPQPKILPIIIAIANINLKYLKNWYAPATETIKKVID